MGDSRGDAWRETTVQLEQASTEGKIYSYRRGMQPPQRKKKYLEKDAEVKHIVSTYHTYENNVLHYMDLLAEVWIVFIWSVFLYKCDMQYIMYNLDLTLFKKFCLH